MASDGGREEGGSDKALTGRGEDGGREEGGSDKELTGRGRLGIFPRISV